MNSRCLQIQAQAAGLASLAPQDRERRTSETHALTCAACAAALAEGAAVMGLVDEALSVAAPPADALARARREILAELAASARRPPSRAPRRGAGAVAAAIVLASVLLAILGGGPGGLQPTVGIRCAAFELAFALGPFVSVFALMRRGRLVRPVATMAFGAAGGALLGQAMLHAACHALPSTSHAFVFHTAPLLLALVLGTLAGLRAAAARK